MSKPDLTKFSLQQLRILELVLKDWPPIAIAAEIGVKDSSVYYSLNKVFMKFDCKTKTNRELICKYKKWFADDN